MIRNQSGGGGVERTKRYEAGERKGGLGERENERGLERTRKRYETREGCGKVGEGETRGPKVNGR